MGSTVRKLVGITVLLLLMAPLVGVNADPHKFKKIVPIITLLFEEDTTAHSLLNDTGIDWGGEHPKGNNLDCLNNATISSPQDCNQGRDATNNDNSDGHAGFSYTKLDVSGNILAASASSWSCVQDNVTGLVWEVKQNKDSSADANNIHDADNKYKWGGITRLGTGYGTYYDDWDALVVGSNDASFCGFKDWRVPTIDELDNLLNFDKTSQSIDTGYFPNTNARDFWSASPHASGPTNAWGVDFKQGESSYLARKIGRHVRVVRGEE